MERIERTARAASLAVADARARRRSGLADPVARPAGHGKTHAVQALAQAWQAWCSVHCRAEIGQGLSRLLNLTDGLLGAGRACILLVTTNEPIGRMHPAVRRPGRCWASIDFGPFEPDEATAWLALNDVDRTVTRPATLAELYAIAEDREIEEVAGVGFGFARALSR